MKRGPVGSKGGSGSGGGILIPVFPRTEYTLMHVLEGSGRQGDRETGRQGDRETGRQGDRESRRGYFEPASQGSHRGSATLIE